MAHPAVNTKIDRLAEAIEDLAVAVAANIAGKSKDEKVFSQVTEGREELREALREFLAPTLKVIPGGKS